MNRPAKEAPARPRLLSGGNPQIPKGYGGEPVQAYIAAMPGWKSDLGKRLDALIVRSVPDVRYFHIHEEDEIDEAQLADWVRQASRLPDEKM